MATGHGSIRQFAYFSDDGAEWYASLDESTYESTDLGFGQSVTAAVYANPQARLKVSSKRPIEPRYVLAQKAFAVSDTLKHKFFVGSTSAPVWGAGVNTMTVAGETWSVTAKIGEKRYLPPALDTANRDGDIDDNVTGGGT